MPALAIWAVVQRFGAGVLSFLGRLNVWQVLLIASLLIGGVQTLRLHSEQRHNVKLEAQLSKIKANEEAAIAQVAKDDAQLETLSRLLRKATDEQDAAIAGDAHALRVSGPGKAVCRPTVSSPSSNGTGAAKPDAAGPALPSADFAAVPWDWLTGRAEEHDHLLTEVQAWRTWHDEVLKVWPKNTGAAPE